MIPDSTFRDLIATYPVLKELPSVLQERIIEEGIYLQISAGSLMYDPGSRCESFPFLISGLFRVMRSTRSGRELVLYRVRSGEVCILTASCVMSRTGHTGRVISETALSIVNVSQVVFNALIVGSQPFREFVFSFYPPQINKLMGVIDDVLTLPLDQRLAQALLKQGDVVRTTHRKLADEVGTVREVVSRTLKAFEEQGLLERRRGKITIKDRQRLSEISGRFGDRDY